MIDVLLSRWRDWVVVARFRDPALILTIEVEADALDVVVAVRLTGSFRVCSRSQNTTADL